MNLAEELPTAEGRILELEDNATQDNNNTPRRRIKALVAILRATLYSNPQEKITIQHFQGKVS